MEEQKTSTSSETAVMPKQYGFFFHPFLFWIELILQLLVPYILPLTSMIDNKPALKSEKSLNGLKKTRSALSSTGAMPLPMIVKRWSKCVGSPIAEYRGTIPVNKNVLEKWGIVNKDSTFEPPLLDDVKVIARFPASLLPHDVQVSEETNKEGCLVVNELDLGNFALDVPLLVYFHGGGFVVGSANTQDGINALVDMSENDLKASNDSAVSSTKPFIFLAVEYSLAPENPFPAAVIDSLSVCDYFLNATVDRKLHFGGASAGANLSLICGLEIQRKYPGRVLSVEAHAPYVLPSADSKSYYQNALVTFPGSDWLRWSWRTYLQMEGTVNNKNKDVPPTTDESGDSSTTSDDIPSIEEDIFRQGSNYDVWEKCKWNSNPMKRLVNPTDGIGGISFESSPKFLITVNFADQLYTEGVNVAKTLQENGATVSLHEHKGSHVIGSDFDTEKNKLRLKEWSDMLYGK